MTTHSAATVISSGSRKVPSRNRCTVDLNVAHAAADFVCAPNANKMSIGPNSTAADRRYVAACGGTVDLALARARFYCLLAGAVAGVVRPVYPCRPVLCPHRL